MSLSKATKTATRGLHIVEAGLVFQLALIIYFLALTIRLIFKLKRTLPPSPTYRRTRLQINVVQLSLFLITVSLHFRWYELSDFLQYRIIYRLVQFTAPEGSSKSNYIKGHEWLIYVFDAGPMFLALLVMNIWHAGNVTSPKSKMSSEYPLLERY
jgi:hypothetical protein